MNVCIRFLLAILTLCSTFCPQVSAEIFSHKEFDELLQMYVQSMGRKSAVDYASLKSNRKNLDSYLDRVQKVSASDFQGWDPYDQLAFLINAYNAFTLQIVIDNYPLESIKDAGTESESVWKRNFFTLFGRKSSLDFIEHELIRKRFNESRIHFALVCAAVSCPPLRTEAYTGKRLNYHLEEQKAKFISDKQRNYWDESTNTIYLSKIFSWFREDFEKAFDPPQPVQMYPLLTLFTEENRPRMVNVKFLPYDWRLNDIKNMQ